MSPAPARASIETFIDDVTNGHPHGTCQIEWTSPDGSGRVADVFHWQRIDGFSPGDIIDVTTEGRAGRTLSLPAMSSTERIEITLDPDDHIVMRVGADGWAYGAIIRGARPYLQGPRT